MVAIRSIQLWCDPFSESASRYGWQPRWTMTMAWSMLGASDHPKVWNTTESHLFGLGRRVRDRRNHGTQRWWMGTPWTLGDRESFELVDDACLKFYTCPGILNARTTPAGTGQRSDLVTQIRGPTHRSVDWKGNVGVPSKKIAATMSGMIMSIMLYHVVWSQKYRVVHQQWLIPIHLGWYRRSESW